MSLEKTEIIEKIAVIDHSRVEVLVKTSIVENGQEISSFSNYHVIAPGEDYSNEDARVQAICAVVHTPEVVAQYHADIEAEFASSKPQI